MLLCAQNTSSSPRQTQCDSEGGSTHQILEKGKPEHGAIRSLPQGHLLKPVTALLAGVELPAHAESQRQHRKSHADNPPLKRDNSLSKCFVRKPRPCALSLRMLPLQMGARAGPLSSTSRAWGTRLALNRGSDTSSDCSCSTEQETSLQQPGTRH